MPQIPDLLNIGIDLNSYGAAPVILCSMFWIQGMWYMCHLAMSKDLMRWLTHAYKISFIHDHYDMHVLLNLFLPSTSKWIAFWSALMLMSWHNLVFAGGTPPYVIPLPSGTEPCVVERRKFDHEIRINSNIQMLCPQLNLCQMTLSHLVNTMSNSWPATKVSCSTGH